MILNKSFSYVLFYELKYRLFGRKYIANIDITDRCNLRCKHCYHKKYLKNLDEKDIPLSLWKKRFQNYKKMGIRHVQLGGGEPTLRHDVIELADKYFPFIYVSTNGQIKVPESFKHRIFVSLDGLKEEHEKMRGKGTFKKIIDNYKNDKRVIFWCVLSKLNYSGEKKFKKFINFVERIKVQGLHIELYVSQRGEDNSFMLTKKQKNEIKNILFDNLANKNSVIFFTKGLVNHILYPSKKIIQKCRIDKKTYFFSALGKSKKCFNSSFDCKRCPCAQAYWVPIYKPLEWFSFYRKKHQYMFKIN